jgi:hypothetical protein
MKGVLRRSSRRWGSHSRLTHSRSIAETMHCCTSPNPSWLTPSPLSGSVKHPKILCVIDALAVEAEIVAGHRLNYWFTPPLIGVKNALPVLNNNWNTLWVHWLSRLF